MIRIIPHTAALLGAALYSAFIHAANPYVQITSPADGATLDAMEQNKVAYEVEPGSQGDHVHIYVDDKEVGILRQLNGSYTLDTLTPGKHELCIRVVNKAHVPTGAEDCITAEVE